MITNNNTTNRRGGGWGISFSLCPSAGRKNPEDKSFLIVDAVMSEGKEGEICPKCGGIVGEDGLCWKCLIGSNK
jgi:hypothetical protein